MIDRFGYHLKENKTKTMSERKWKPKPNLNFEDIIQEMNKCTGNISVDEYLRDSEQLDESNVEVAEDALWPFEQNEPNICIKPIKEMLRQTNGVISADPEKLSPIERKCYTELTDGVIKTDRIPILLDGNYFKLKETTFAASENESKKSGNGIYQTFAHGDELAKRFPTVFGSTNDVEDCTAQAECIEEMDKRNGSKFKYELSSIGDIRLTPMNQYLARKNTAMKSIKSNYVMLSGADDNENDNSFDHSPNEINCNLSSSDNEKAIGSNSKKYFNAREVYIIKRMKN